MGPNRRAQERKRAATRAAVDAKRVAAERKAAVDRAKDRPRCLASPRHRRYAARGRAPKTGGGDYPAFPPSVFREAHEPEPPSTTRTRRSGGC
jgi:hypothetical protein